MTRNPMVSIVCTNFNKGDWIRDAIESFLAQKTDFEYEIIIIDDASIDNSPKVIEEYARKHPNRIRALYNKKNLGITKTWIKACKSAKGTYIARCDGDDYWIDAHKLQKQVDALESANGSAWSSTDFDIILPDGTKTHTAAFKNGIMTRASSYEDILATKGFTMASTWLVKTELMLDINNAIDANTVDDTFNIQIELFHRTKPTYLPHPMVAYRVGYESDSHPIDLQKVKQRNDRLLKTQLEYVEKYQDVDFSKMFKIAIRANTNLEAMLADAKSELRDARQTIKNQNKAITYQHEQIEAIRNSRRYKLGTILTYPLSFIKSVKSKVGLR